MNIYVDDPAELQPLANERTLARLRRTAGLICLVFGLLDLAQAPRELDGRLASYLQLAIGGALVANGALLLRRHTTLALISGGLLVIATEGLELWQILSRRAMGTWALAGVAISTWLLLIGASWLLHARRLAPLPRVVPSPELARALDQIAKTLALARAAARPDILELATRGRLVENSWKAQLLPDRVFLVTGTPGELLILAREDFAIELAGPTGAGRLKVDIHLGPRRLAGSIKAEGWRRYMQWKQHAPDGAIPGLWVPPL